ncbi:MAG TPA: site-specific integrase [Holophagaceae bacterium]|jgi:integrase|nr:site-specific integrase [Holophagaceae bacterium]
MPRARLNARTVNAAKPEAKVYSLFDEAVPGFHVRIKPSGVKGFFVKLTVDGRQRMLGLGGWPSVTVEEARKLALEARGKVSKGTDPVEERKRRRSDLTLTAFLDTFLERHVEAKLKPRTAGHYSYLVSTYIAPELGRVRLGALLVSDIAKLHHKLADTPRVANQCVRLLGKALERAAAWGYEVKVASVRAVELFPEVERIFRLEAADAVKLAEAMDAEAESGNRHAVLALRLLLITGMRRGELVGLQWDQVNFRHSALNLPDSKTGAKAVPLSKPALAILRSLQQERRLGQKKVLDWGTEDGAVTAMVRAWHRIRVAASLPDMRIHDLRHAFASAALDAGEPLEAIAKLLGQSIIATTQRYAHLGEGRAKQGAEAAGQAMDKLLRGAQ